MYEISILYARITGLPAKENKLTHEKINPQNLKNWHPLYQKYRIIDNRCLNAIIDVIKAGLHLWTRAQNVR